MLYAKQASNKVSESKYTEIQVEKSISTSDVQGLG